MPEWVRLDVITACFSLLDVFVLSATVPIKFQILASCGLIYNVALTLIVFFARTEFLWMPGGPATGEGTETGPGTQEAIPEEPNG